MNEISGQHGQEKTRITVVIPVYNEGNNVMPVCLAISDVWNDLRQYDRQVIFVDDGSKDDTWSKIVSASKSDHSVKGIRFTRNFGKDAAIEAGLKESSGEAVIVMDGDLQHPPELILEFVKAWKAGNDIIRARNENPPHRSFLKRLSSSLFYRLLNISSETAIAPGSSDFCLMSRRVVNKLNSLTEKGRFYRVLAQWTGFRSISIPYKAKERVNGKSVYTFSKLFSLARAAIVSSSTMPMTVIFLFGCALVLLGTILTTGLLLYKYLIDWEFIGGAVVLAAFVIFNNGILLLAFGIMSLYQIAVYQEVRNRPNFIIQEST